MQEIADFFPGRRRDILKKALAKLDTMTERAADLAMKRLDSPALDAKLEALLSDASSDAGNSPE